MTITARLWDKKSPINGRDAAFLTEHFKKQGGTDDRVLISYDGVISQIQHVKDTEFTAAEKDYMQSLISDGMGHDEAIAATWEQKARATYEQGLLDAEIHRLQEALAATDYKIVKCSEYSLAGLPAPYNIPELHQQRQTLRDSINKLEDA